VAIVNHYYLARMIASAEPEDDDDPIDPNAQEVVKNVGIFFPNQNDRGTHINISGAAVLQNAPDYDNAVAFLEFLASPQAQQLFAEQGFEYPVVAGVEASSVIADFGTFKSDTLNVASYGEYNPEAVQIMDRVGWK
jgi:iron(III) transport system substrate-binding protein